MPKADFTRCALRFRKRDDGPFRWLLRPPSAEAGNPQRAIDDTTPVGRHVKPIWTFAAKGYFQHAVLTPPFAHNAAAVRGCPIAAKNGVRLAKEAGSPTVPCADNTGAPTRLRARLRNTTHSLSFMSRSMLIFLFMNNAMGALAPGVRWNGPSIFTRDFLVCLANGSAGASRLRGLSMRQVHIRAKARKHENDQRQRGAQRPS